MTGLEELRTAWHVWEKGSSDRQRVVALEAALATVAEQAGLSPTALRLRLIDARRAGLPIECVIEALPGDLRAEADLETAVS